MRLMAQLLAALAATSAAQALAQSGANVTIQLPNFSVFGVNTSVLVPDSGPSPLARERQARYSRSMYRGGFNPQRAIGAQRRAAAASATAQIHDPQATDATILRAARSRRTNWLRGSTSKFDRPPPPSGAGLQSVADIVRQRALAEAADNREAQSLLDKARQASSDGKNGVAAIYYGMAAKKAAGQLHQDIESEARKLKAAAARAAMPAERTK